MLTVTALFKLCKIVACVEGWRKFSIFLLDLLRINGDVNKTSVKRSVIN